MKKPKSNSTPALISMKAGARKIGISESLFLREVAGAKVAMVTIGAKRFVRAADVDRFIASIGREVGR